MIKQDIKDIIEKIESLLGNEDSITLNESDSALDGIREVIDKASVRQALMSNADISVGLRKKDGVINFSRLVKKVVSSNPNPSSALKSKPKPKKFQHSYIPPKISKDIIDALLDDASHVLWFKGPTGTGKTVLAEYISRELDMELFKVNCDGSMGKEGFFGDKTVEIDEATGQNHIVFKDGPVVKAMQTGLDKDGNEVGKPGLLFLDEAGSIPAHIAISLNHLLEGDNPRRTIALTDDNGRVIKSHSKFRIILAANTAGRGATSVGESVYTAQMDALDISLLNRIGMTFPFGYDRKIERNIALEKIGNDRIVQQLIKFRDAIRDLLRAEKLSTPFSTRHIIKISDSFRVYGSLSKAIFYTTFEQLLPEERAAYNEIANAELGVDILKEFQDNNIDYM